MRVEDVSFKAVKWVHDGADENGQYPIYLRFGCNNLYSYLSTTYRTEDQHWDPEKDVLLDTHPQYDAIIRKVQALTDDVKFEIRLAEENGTELTLSAIKKIVKAKSKPQSRKPAVKAKLFAFYEIVIADLEKAKKPGSANVFRSSCNSLKKVFKNDKSFIAFTKDDFLAYEKFLKDTVPEETTISIYLRTFYNVWNKAQKKKLCPEEHHPKFHIEFKPYRRFQTKKRTIEKKYITALANLKLDMKGRHNRSRYVFLLLYYLRGMEFCDVILLKKGENWYGNRMRYKRKKNGRKYDFKLHPKALAILKYFDEVYPFPSDGGYILPFLTSYHDTERRIKNRTVSALRDVNEDLTDLEKKIKCPKHITTKVAKHAVASHLRKAKADIKVIQETLGHDTEEQSNIYMEAIDADDEVADILEGVL